MLHCRGHPCPCAPARNAPGNRSLVESVGTRLGDATVFSFSCRFLCFAAHSPCPPLLACAVAAGPLRVFRLRASAAGSLSLENRSAFKLDTSNFTLLVAQPPSMPCAENAIQALRPSFARSSMIGLPAAASSSRVANRDVLSAASRNAATDPVGTSTRVPAGVETLLLPQHRFARRWSNHVNR